MTALAQGTAGLALVMCFGLLGARQVASASILLAIQAVAVAVAALAQHQPLIAGATAAIDVVGALWFLYQQRIVSAGSSRSALAPPEGPIGGAKSGIIPGAVMAVLCESGGPLALPLAVVLLSVLLAATRQHRLMQLMALISLQNGVALASCLMVPVPLVALACFVLPLPFAAGLALRDPARHHIGLPVLLRRWLGWMQLAISITMLAASLVISLNPIAATFAPLVALWGTVEAWEARHRIAQRPARRVAAVVKLGLMLVAVGTTQPVLAWLAVLGALSAALFPTLPRQHNDALLAFCGAGLAIFGLMTMPGGIAPVWNTALFVGYAAIAAVVPDLGVILGVLILRLTVEMPLPSIASDILVVVAVAGLLGSSIMLADGAGFITGTTGALSDRTKRLANRTTQGRLSLMSLVQTSIAAVALGLDRPDTRFAAAVLLFLLILTRSAAPIARGPSAIAASAGLAGIPPLGVFPGLVLVLLAISSHAPWLLLPVGLGLVGVIGTAITEPGRWWDAGGLSPGRVAGVLGYSGLAPILLAFLFGFSAPVGMIDWLRAVTAAGP